MSTPRQLFESPSHRSGRERNPYFFRREPADVLEEAFRELLRLRMAAASDGGTPTPASLRSSGPYGALHGALEEQWRTLFAYDPTMQRVFHGDVDAFCVAMTDPERMHAALESRFRELETLHAESETETEENTSPHAPAHRTEWSDGDTPARAWEESHTHAEHPHSSVLDEDPVYDAAFRWTCRVERWSRDLQVQQKLRDVDLFRISTNITLVPAKVAFGFSGGVDDDLAGLETGALGYRLAAILLTRVLDAMGNCYAKGLGEEKFVHEFLDEGRELLADIESRLAEIESEMRYRGTRS